MESMRAKAERAAGERERASERASQELTERKPS